MISSSKVPGLRHSLHFSLQLLVMVDGTEKTTYDFGPPHPWQEEAKFTLSTLSVGHVISWNASKSSNTKMPLHCGYEMGNVFVFTGKMWKMPCLALLLTLMLNNVAQGEASCCQYYLVSITKSFLYFRKWSCKLWIKMEFVVLCRKTGQTLKTVKFCIDSVNWMVIGPGRGVLPVFFGSQ